MIERSARLNPKRRGGVGEGHGRIMGGEGTAQENGRKRRGIERDWEESNCGEVKGKRLECDEIGWVVNG